MATAKAFIMAMALLMSAPHATSEPPVAPVAPPVEVELTAKGKATWFDATKNGAWFTQEPRPGAKNRNQDGSPYEFYAAAGPALRALKQFEWGMEPYRAIVENVRNGRAIIVTVVDWCQCRQGADEKLIDLSPAAFEALAGDGNLGLGVLKVRVTVMEE